MQKGEEITAAFGEKREKIDLTSEDARQNVGQHINECRTGFLKATETTQSEINALTKEATNSFSTSIDETMQNIQGKLEEINQRLEEGSTHTEQTLEEQTSGYLTEMGEILNASSKSISATTTDEPSLANNSAIP